MDFHTYTVPGTQHKSLHPWYELRQSSEDPIVFGHWSTLGAGYRNNAISLDSGCVWGRQLTAIRLAPKPEEFVNIACG